MRLPRSELYTQESLVSSQVKVYQAGNGPSHCSVLLSPVLLASNFAHSIPLSCESHITETCSSNAVSG